MTMKGITEVLVRSVTSLYDGAKTRVRVDYELSGDFEVKLGVHYRSMLSPLIFFVLVDVVTE